MKRSKANIGRFQVMTALQAPRRRAKHASRTKPGKDQTLETSPLHVAADNVISLAEYLERHKQRGGKGRRRAAA